MLDTTSSGSEFHNFFTEFIEATRITGDLSKHRQKSYNAYYPNS